MSRSQPKTPVSLRMSEEKLDEFDESLERAKQKGLVPPTASRSDLIRICMEDFMDTLEEDDEEVAETVRSYFLKP